MLLFYPQWLDIRNQDRNMAIFSEQFPTKVCREGEGAGAGREDEEGNVKHSNHTHYGGETKPSVIMFFETICLMQWLSTSVPRLFAKRPVRLRIQN